jgi:hypothetical protein
MAAQAAAAPGVAAEIPPAPLEDAQHVCRADRTPVRIPARRLMTGCNCSKDIPASEAVGAPVTSSEAEVLGASPVASPEAGCQSGRDAHALMPSVNQHCHHGLWNFHLPCCVHVTRLEAGIPPTPGDWGQPEAAGPPPARGTSSTSTVPVVDVAVPHDSDVNPTQQAE